MLWNWFTKRPSINLTDENRADKLPELIAYLNDKYGDFEYAKDARALDYSHKFEDLFTRLLKRAVAERNARSVLLTGANSGVELDLLSNFEVTALDLSDSALDKLSEHFPNVTTVRGDMQNLPFPDKTFDLYVSMRSIHASNLNIRKALQESLRVTKAVAIYSISNAYNVEGELVPGMYNYDTGQIERDLPYRHLATLKDFLSHNNCPYEVYDLPSEIVVHAELSPVVA